MTPLTMMLSQVLVAITIELDNEFELQMSKTWARPFKVSLPMWSNFMRFVGGEGVSVGDLTARSCIPANAVASNVGGMERWGYIAVDHDPAGGHAGMRKGFGTARGVNAGTMIYPSQTGTLAKNIWEKPLVADIEARWTSRLGDGLVDRLRDALASVQNQIRLVMPHYQPIPPENGLFANAALESGDSDPDDDLPALLSRVLLAVTLDFEKDSEVSLAIGANLLRVLGDEGTPQAELPLMTGISKEAVSLSMTWLGNEDYIAVEPNPKGRGKVVRVTPKGREAQNAYTQRLEEVEAEWTKRYGPDVEALRDALGSLLDQPGGEQGSLSASLVTPPGGWRGTGAYKKLTAAFVEDPRSNLPHYPFGSRRGGWPDGS